MASDLAYDGVLRLLGLGVPVENVFAPLHETLARVAEALYEVRDVAEVFWIMIMPLHGDMTYAGEDGLSISTYALERLADGAEDAVMWESLIPRPVPDEVRALLPERPIRPVPALVTIARLGAAAAAADVYARRRALVEDLEQRAAHALDREFAARHRARLAPIRDRTYRALADAEGEPRQNLGTERSPSVALLLADVGAVVADHMSLGAWAARWPPDEVDRAVRAAVDVALS